VLSRLPTQLCAVLWLCAGGAFDFGTAFGIVMTGCVVGMSMQYWAARLLFKEKVSIDVCHIYWSSSSVPAVGRT
jgi:uncharacterized membrane protein YdjX (TVP38/TMEM64 family)